MFNAALHRCRTTLMMVGAAVGNGGDAGRRWSGVTKPLLRRCKWFGCEGSGPGGASTETAAATVAVALEGGVEDRTGDLADVETGS